MYIILSDDHYFSTDGHTILYSICHVHEPRIQYFRFSMTFTRTAYELRVIINAAAKTARDKRNYILYTYDLYNAGLLRFITLGFKRVIKNILLKNKTLKRSYNFENS